MTLLKTDLPVFLCATDEAAYWSTHSVADYIDLAALLTNAATPPADAALPTNDLPDALRQQLAALAAEYGVEPAALIWRWRSETQQERAA